MPLGLSGLSSVLAASLGRYRPYFIILALVMLGTGHYLVYRRKNTGRIDRVIIWVSTGIVILVLVFF